MVTLLKDDWADWDGIGTPPVGTVYTSAAANAVAKAVNTGIGPSNVTSPLLGSNRLVGDNSTNNTTALAALLGDANINDLYFPVGVYRYSNIAITRTTPIRLWGPGTLRSTLSTTDPASALRLLGSDVTIRDLTLDYVTPVDFSDNGTRGGPLLQLGDNTAGTERHHITVDRCTLREAREFAVFGVRCNDLKITNCTIERSWGAGIWVGNSTDTGGVLIAGNYIYNTGDDPIWAGNDVAMGIPMSGVVVADNNCELSDSKGIGFGGVIGGVITGNVVKNTWAPGIQIVAGSSWGQQTNHDITVENNVVIDGGKNFGVAGRGISATMSTIPNGIEVDGAGNTNITVRGNTIVGSQQWGVFVERGDNFTIADNTIVDSGADGIFAGNIPDADYDRFTDLTIDGNTVINSVVGMRVGSVDGLTIRNNYLRSFNVGDTGETYGILYGWVKNATITGNHFVNDDAADFLMFENPGTTNPFCEVGANTEVVTTEADKNVRSLTTINHHRFGFGSAKPTTGTWIQGDVIINTGVLTFGNVGWICRVGGTPGTWQPWGISQLGAAYDNTTWNPASIANGAMTSTTVTVSTAALGDLAIAAHSVAIPAGCQLTANVTSANTVTVTLMNHSGSTQDIASGTLTVFLFRVA